jgi:hypothetical protein
MRAFNAVISTNKLRPIHNINRLALLLNGVEPLANPYHLPQPTSPANPRIKNNIGNGMGRIELMAIMISDLWNRCNDYSHSGITEQAPLILNPSPRG